MDSHVSPKQILVQAFEGHTAAVRELHVLDNENSFVSASKDRTVKLWSVRSQVRTGKGERMGETGTAQAGREVREWEGTVWMVGCYVAG